MPLSFRMPLLGPRSFPLPGGPLARGTELWAQRLPLGSLGWRLTRSHHLTVKKSLELRGCFGLFWRVDGMKIGVKYKLRQGYEEEKQVPFFHYRRLSPFGQAASVLWGVDSGPHKAGDGRH